MNICERLLRGVEEGDGSLYARNRAVQVLFQAVRDGTLDAEEIEGLGDTVHQLLRGGGVVVLRYETGEQDRRRRYSRKARSNQVAAWFVRAAAAGYLPQRVAGE
jgi:hypothetical protein